MLELVIDKVLDLIYPRRCPICGHITDDKENFICSQCAGKIISIKEPRCMKCSKPIMSVETEYCYDCEKADFRYKKGKAVWVYDEWMKQSIGAFKYNGRKEYSKFYGKVMAEKYGKWVHGIEADALIPIPLHKQKKRVRGFNQAELIAKEVSGRLGVPVRTDILLRERYTMPQKQLNNVERYRNLTKAFKVSKNITNLNKVILIDDIYTTGSTIEACTNVLMEHGIKEVYFLSICIGKGY